jgi:hypothetical protein
LAEENTWVSTSFVQSTRRWLVVQAAFGPSHAPPSPAVTLPPEEHIDARASINNVGINHASSKHGSSQHNDDRDKSWSQGGVQPLDRLTLSFTLQAEQKSGRIQGLPSVKDLASACYSRQIRMAQHGSMRDLLSEFLLRVKYTLLRTKWLHFAQRSHRRRRANTTGLPSTTRACLLPIGMGPHLCWR